MNITSLSVTLKAIPKQLILGIAVPAFAMSSAIVQAADPVLATANGINITQSQFNIAAAQSKIDVNSINDQQKKLLLDALINRTLVLDEAQKKGFDKEPVLAARIKALKESFIAANYLSKVAKDFTVEEKAMKDYYEKNVVKNASNEFKARHILVKTEDEAKSIIKSIQGGADFSATAKEKSVDTGSAAKGGDLGWFSEKDMVEPFAKAVAKLNKGELSSTPVKSDFGWHVIILDDSKQSEPPTFSDVKANIEQVLVKQQLNQYLTDLNSKAKIVYK